MTAPSYSFIAPDPMRYAGARRRHWAGHKPPCCPGVQSQDNGYPEKSAHRNRPRPACRIPCRPPTAPSGRRWPPERWRNRWWMWWCAYRGHRWRHRRCCGGVHTVATGGVTGVVVVVYGGVLPLGHHRCLHCQTRRVVVFMPCTDALHCRDDKHHDHNTEHQNEHYIEHVDPHSKSHRVSPFAGQT